MSKTVLVGASGFIGRHLCELLATKGEPALILTRGSQHHRHALSPVIQYADFGQLHRPGFLAKCETLVYLAASGTPGRTWNDFVDPSTTILPSFATVLQAAITANPTCQIVVLSSGGQIYGPGHTTPIAECAPQNPTTAYALEKQLVENLCEFARVVRDANIATLRAANPVGYWQTRTSHGLLSAAIRAALNGADLMLFGNGLNVRDYFAVEELCELILSFQNANRGKSGVYNVGSGIGHTDLDVVALVERSIGIDIHIVEKPARPFDLPYAVLDAALAKEELGFCATTSLDTIIQQIVGRIKKETI